MAEQRAPGLYGSQSRGVSTPMEATYCFIDIAGFTALTEVQGDQDAADLASMFFGFTRSALGPKDRLVKTLGDAVLVTSPTPGGAITLVEGILARTAKSEDFPPLRAGLHHGTAIERGGDVFGAAVNMAARVSNEAYAGEVLGTQAVADAANAIGIPVAELGPVALKNVSGEVELFSLGIIVGATETPIDPVCQVPVDRRSAAGHLRYKGREYWFCSMTCAAAFSSNPEWHAVEHEH